MDADSANRKDPALNEPIAVDAVAALDAAEATELVLVVVPVDPPPPVLEIVGAV
jgi:translation initiation factor IF-3